MFLGNHSCARELVPFLCWSLCKHIDKDARTRTQIQDILPQSNTRTLHLARQPEVCVWGQAVYIVQPIYFHLARSMAAGGSRVSCAALPLWGAEKAGSGSLGQRDLTPPGSFISHLLAVGSSTFIGDRDPRLVNGGREPEKEVVEGTYSGSPQPA